MSDVLLQLAAAGYLLLAAGHAIFRHTNWDETPENVVLVVVGVSVGAAVLYLAVGTLVAHVRLVWVP